MIHIMRTVTPPPRTCLDVGCGGNGEYDFYPRCRIDSGHIILLDISYPCEKVRRLVKSLPHVSFIVADCRYLPIRSSSIERIYMYHVLEHVKDDQDAIFECWRVLKDWGCLHIAVPNIFSIHSDADPTHVHKYTIFTLWRRVKKSGRWRNITPEPTAGSKIPKILRIPIIALFYTFSEEVRLRAVARK